LSKEKELQPTTEVSYAKPVAQKLNFLIVCHNKTGRFSLLLVDNKIQSIAVYVSG
jgi:hypothetical protein